MNPRSCRLGIGIYLGVSHPILLNKYSKNAVPLYPALSLQPYPQPSLENRTLLRAYFLIRLAPDNFLLYLVNAPLFT